MSSPDKILNLMDENFSERMPQDSPFVFGESQSLEQEVTPKLTTGSVLKFGHGNEKRICDNCLIDFDTPKESVVAENGAKFDEQFDGRKHDFSEEDEEDGHKIWQQSPPPCSPAPPISPRNMMSNCKRMPNPLESIDFAVRLPPCSPPKENYASTSNEFEAEELTILANQSEQGLKTDDVENENAGAIDCANQLSQSALEYFTAKTHFQSSNSSLEIESRFEENEGVDISAAKAAIEAIACPPTEEEEILPQEIESNEQQLVPTTSDSPNMDNVEKMEQELESPLRPPPFSMSSEEKELVFNQSVSPNRDVDEKTGQEPLRPLLSPLVSSESEDKELVLKKSDSPNMDKAEKAEQRFENPPLSPLAPNVVPSTTKNEPDKDVRDFSGLGNTNGKVLRDSLDSFGGQTYSESGFSDLFPRSQRGKNDENSESGISSPSKLAAVRLMRKAVREREKLLSKIQWLETQVKEMTSEKRSIVSGITQKEEEVNGLLEAQRIREKNRFLELKLRAKKTSEDFEKQIALKEGEIAELRQKIIELESQAAKVEGRMDAEIEKFKTEISSRSSTIDTLAKMVEDKETLIASLKQDVENLTSETGKNDERLSRELHAAKNDLKDLEWQLAEEQKKAELAETKFDEEKANLELQMAENSHRIQAEYQSLREKYVEESRERKRLYNQVLELKGNIRVFCRVRPMNAEETLSGELSVVETDSGKEEPTDISVRSAQGAKKVFKFDRSFSQEEDQAAVFAETSPVVTSVLDGFNVCIFAYGQTGSGKTYTMEGTAEDRGVNFRTLEQLFEVSRERHGHYNYQISVSVLEVYNEQIRDLLVNPNANNSKKLEVKQSSDGGHYVPGLTESSVDAVETAWKVLQTGYKNRSTGATSSNAHSSRSHCMLSVTVKGENLLSGEVTKSRLWLVDLAGSERVSKSEVSGDRLKEAQNINKSLSALGDVIAALMSKSPHIPYRNSKLTHLLQDSLGGDAKALMFVQISPSPNDAPETVCSLQFASRVRGVELGQARKHLDSGELQRFKQIAEKARFEAKQKEEASKKAEEGLRSMEAKLIAKDQLCNALSAKVQDSNKALHGLETQLANERVTRGQAETTVKELQAKLQELLANQAAAAVAEKELQLVGAALKKIPEGRIAQDSAEKAPLKSVTWLEDSGLAQPLNSTVDSGAVQVQSKAKAQIPPRYHNAVITSPMRFAKPVIIAPKLTTPTIGKSASVIAPKLTNATWLGPAVNDVAPGGDLSSERVPLSGMKQNRQPLDYLEKFEEFKKRKAESQLAQPGNFEVGTSQTFNFGVSAVPGSETRRQSTISRLGSRGGGVGAQRIVQKRAAGSKPVDKHAGRTVTGNSRVWQ